MSKKKFDNLSKNTESLQSGLSSLLGGTKLVEKETTEKKEVKYIRHTVLFDPQDLEFIKDFVHYKRIKGEIEYTQKETLGEAIRLLRENNPNVKPRKK